MAWQSYCTFTLARLRSGRYNSITHYQCISNIQISRSMRLKIYFCVQMQAGVWQPPPRALCSPSLPHLGECALSLMKAQRGAHTARPQKQKHTSICKRKSPSSRPPPTCHSLRHSPLNLLVLNSVALHGLAPLSSIASSNPSPPKRHAARLIPQFMEVQSAGDCHAMPVSPQQRSHDHCWCWLMKKTSCLM